ncbi:MAG: SufBD protein [Anaerovoracaceae bacterium]|jgi:hypothetical protein
MLNIENLLNGLMDHDDKKAYEYLKELEERSISSSEVYSFFDNFVEMIDSDKSYVRTRGILLIAANAKWDTDNKIDGIIDKFLGCVTDEKPITARQCIRTLPTIVKYKRGLKGCIVNALRDADLSNYRESMHPLILKDIQQALNEIGGL